MPQRPSLPPARKRLGQHFLTDRTALERIVQAVDPQPGETIVEIGPGRGALTDLLAQRAERLVCVEVDPLLVPVLRARYADRPHISIVEGDVLDVELPSLATGAWALVGNVPYYITTPIIFQALRSPRPSRMVFLVQREVAERVAAPPGSEEYGALSVNVQALARAEVVVAGEGVSPEVLALAPPTAEFIGAEGGSSPAAQSPEEVGRLLAASARAGKRVVRLIGGDPYLFGGGGEEAEWLAGARVPFEVVPGVSALVAGPNCAGFPLAHRQWASQITLLAGTEAPAAVDWAQVARAPGTRVIALAPERIGPTVELLAAQGLAPETPVAVVGPALRFTDTTDY